MKRFLFLLLAVLLVGSIVYLTSSISNPYDLLPYRLYYRLKTDEIFGVRIIEIVSEIIHLLLFGCLAALFTVFLVGKRKLTSRHLIIAVGFTVFVGALSEIHQIKIPTRAFQMVDLIFNVIGAIIGVLFIRNRYLRSRKIGKSLNTQ